MLIVNIGNSLHANCSFEDFLSISRFNLPNKPVGYILLLFSLYRRGNQVNLLNNTHLVTGRAGIQTWHLGICIDTVSQTSHETCSAYGKNSVNVFFTAGIAIGICICENFKL